MRTLIFKTLSGKKWTQNKNVFRRNYDKRSFIITVYYNKLQVYKRKSRLFLFLVKAMVPLSIQSFMRSFLLHSDNNAMFVRNLGMVLRLKMTSGFSLEPSLAHVKTTVSRFFSFPVVLIFTVFSPVLLACCKTWTGLD